MAEDAPPQTRRNGWLWALGLIIVLIIVIWMLSNREGNRQRDQLEQAPDTTARTMHAPRTAE